ncbi:MAG: SUMF1/EgtB/PvdO family nonheme iron enzyme [Ktedonobacterales bacterium]|nr:SUMF1/EgtB/PvdO family nonheme iron enzyme [Ktedonobacterales bacterium]
MHIDTLLNQLLPGGAPLAVIPHEADRDEVYAQFMRRLDRMNPLLVRSHSPQSIVLRNGGCVRIITRADLLAEMDGLAEIAIPAGSFWLGREHGYMDERPMLHLPSPAFAIMKFPVTVFAYALAVRAGGVIPPVATFSLSWEDQQTHPAHPVVMVNQEEAEIFAAWLAHLTGQPWRLPTEMEWEYAARGADDQRLYPWGEAHEPHRVNVANQEEGRLTPTDESRNPVVEMVGSRPGTESPFGVSDMVGNVDEWTSSPYLTYGAPAPNNPALTMVARGGNYTMDLHPLTHREIVSRYESRRTLGFRLVRSR